jgi:hypothetical protein
MSTKYESAKLILELYDLRREAKMREARDWFYNFKPKSTEEILAIYKSQDSAKFRMVLGYWDMAASLVNHGAIDESMFADANGECLFVFAKMQPFLDDLRKGQPNFLLHLENFVKKMPNGLQTIEFIRKNYM